MQSPNYDHRYYRRNSNAILVVFYTTFAIGILSKQKNYDGTYNIELELKCDGFGSSNSSSLIVTKV